MKTAAGSGLLSRIARLVPALMLLSVPLVTGQGRDEYGAGQARDDYGEIRQTVARISWLEGSVSFARGDDPGNWQAADRNVPMTIGDRIYTGSRSRVELQIQGGAFVRLGAQTDLAALNLTDDTKQFSVNSGVASFHIRQLNNNEVFEIDTPNAAVTVDRPGYYRIDVDQDGNSRVSVRQGAATVAAGGGQVPLRAGEEIAVDGIDAPRYDVYSMRRTDGWDQWVDQRQTRAAGARSLQYVSQDIVGAGDLDDYGQWQEIPDYGRAWAPASVSADWAPYRVGHWIWQDPWGWTWVSGEPWGWAPYHYGRWVTYSSRWYWVPVAHSVSIASYSPALVAFVGGGPGGFSASVAIGGGGFVGWFPLGPRDPFNPWWSHRREANVNVTNVTYVNRTYVTVVNQNTFVSGGIVNTAIVRDRTVMRDVVSAPVMRGPLPVVPTTASLRVAATPNLPAAPRPPAAVVDRSVVARIAPPPAPPSFQAKLNVIRENRGAPVAPVEAAKISVETRGRAQAITNVRPVASGSGQVTLAPRGSASAAGARQVEPVSAAPVRGRPAATAQQPVSAAPVTSSGTSTGQGREAQPSREIAPRPATQAPVGQPIPPAPQQPTRPAPPAERAVAPERAVPPAGRIAPTPSEQSQPNDWRNRERPAQLAPRDGSPQTPQPKPTPQPVGRGREGIAPPPERPVEQPNRVRENATPPPQPERRRFERPTPEPQRAPAEARPAPPQARPAEERPASPPPREARPQPQPPPERQVERPAPQKSDPKKDEKAKQDDKKKKDEQKKKDDQERKPE